MLPPWLSKLHPPGAAAASRVNVPSARSVTTSRRSIDPHSRFETYAELGLPAVASLVPTVSSLPTPSAVASADADTMTTTPTAMRPSIDQILPASAPGPRDDRAGRAARRAVRHAHPRAEPARG